MQATHVQHLMFYGSNGKRMDSQCIAKFSSGVENRNASIRIPFCISPSSGGFYEDRRPASNMDPYLVTMMLVCTTHRIPLPLEVSAPHGTCLSGSTTVLPQLFCVTVREFILGWAVLFTSVVACIPRAESAFLSSHGSSLEPGGGDMEGWSPLVIPKSVQLFMSCHVVCLQHTVKFQNLL